jgi:hypothetical protein
MSFLRHQQIYQSDPGIKTRGDAESGSAPRPIVLMSLRPAIPWQVGLHQWDTRRFVWTKREGTAFAPERMCTLIDALRPQQRPRAQWCF